MVVSVAGPLLVLGLLAYLLASHGHEIEQATKRTSIGQLFVVTGLSLLTLVARTEAVVACLNAMDSSTAPRRHSCVELAHILGRNDQPLRLEHRAWRATAKT